MNDLTRALIQNDGLHAWVGEHDGIVAGVGMLERIDGTDPDAFVGRPPLSIHGATGLAKNFYIQDPFRGNGIGSALMATLLDTADDHDLDAVVAEAWIRPDTRDATQLLDKYDFIPVHRSTEYWTSCSIHDSIEECDCEGALYMKLLDGI
jgi:GNAT superfamily N-acetyltransferase